MGGRPRVTSGRLWPVSYSLPYKGRSSSPRSTSSARASRYQVTRVPEVAALPGLRRGFPDSNPTIVALPTPDLAASSS